MKQLTLLRIFLFQTFLYEYDYATTAEHVDCGTNFVLDNGQIDFAGQQTVFNHTIPVRCDPGYDLHGDHFTTCFADGTWSKKTTCVVKDCGAHYSVDHGNVDFNGQNTTFQNKVLVTCDVGYEIDGAPEITCLANGLWSTDSKCRIKDCGTNFVLDNGQIDFAGQQTVFNYTIPVKCDPGYDLLGDHFTTCLADGTWSKKTTCVVKDCGAHYPVDHGNVDFNGQDTTFKNKVLVTCDVGYETDGAPEIICLANGLWSIDSKCRIKDCGINFVLDNGQIDFAGQQTVFNHTIPVKCDPGYDLLGDHFTTCLADGTWSKKATCVVKDCGSTYRLENGFVNFDDGDTTFNQNILVFCDTGYEIKGPGSITCLSDGSWSTETFCEIVDCGQKYRLVNGYVNFDDRETTFTQKVPVFCYTGYEIKGPSSITCLSDGSWSTETSCQIVDCGPNYPLVNGYVNFDGRDTTFNQKIPVFCYTGYEVKGPGSVRCLSDGSWSTETYCQEVDCGKKYTLINGHVDFTGRETTYTQIIPVSCYIGYEIKGKHHITCLSDGTWSKDTTCQIKDCGTDVSIPNGHVKFGGRETIYNNKFLVICDPGYEIYGDSEIICLHHGSWSNSSSCQIKDCGRNYSLKNGFVDFTGKATTFNQQVPVSCDTGYEIIGDHSITCLSDGTWSKDTICLIKDCGNDLTIANGHVEFDGGETTYNNTFRVICDLGYEIHGDPEIICLHHGSWSDSSSCLIKDCGTYYPLANGKASFTGRKTTFKQRVSVFCYPGYEVHGDVEITCLSSGTWSRDTFCLKKDCGNGFTIANGHVEFDGRETTYNHAFPVICDPGYEIDGDPEIICLHHGSWSNSSSCQIRDCGRKYPLENGFVNFDGRETTFNEKVPVSCETGFEIKGKHSITCLSDSTWSKDSTCHIKDCGNQYILRNGKVKFTGRETTYNQTVPVVCDLGYGVHGDVDIRCLSDGTWSIGTTCQKKGLEENL